MIRIQVLALILLSYISLQAQQFGAFPPSVKWKQISTDTARIIFQPQAKAQAQSIAAIIHQLAAQQPNPLGDRLRKINIILHSNTTLANGYVGLGPYRSEFYLVPSSNTVEMGNLPWHEHLAVHEYRHVQQYNNMNKGLAKAFRLIFGEEGQAIANGITIPNWFFEGDAVHTETANTPQGRGRLPYFLSGYNSVFLEGKQYRLMKMLNGSLKDYVPNHYNFGYMAVNYGYEKYGSDFWGKVINDAASFKGLAYPFRQAIQKHAGVSYRSFIKDALQHSQQTLQPDKGYTTPKDKTVTNYYFPQFISPDSIIYLKESYRSLPAFYVRTQGEEHKIKLRSISTEDWFSYRNGVIAYTAFATDARWELIDYSDIVLLDIQSKRERRLTSKGKYYTPDISPSGKNIVTISVNDSTQTELQLLDAVTGQVHKKVPAPKGTYFLHPRFLDDENIIFIERAPDGSMSLHKRNLVNGNSETLLEAGYNTLGHPFVQGETIYFTSSASGNDDLYALRDGKFYQLTSGQTGHYYVGASADSLAWASFTAKGLRLQTASMKTLPWTEVTPATLRRPVTSYDVATVSSNVLATPTRDFPVARYAKSTRLLNIHSWRPYYEDPEFTFSIFSNNILNTLSSELFYRYNQNEESHGVGVNAIYGGWFPQITTGAEYTYDRHVYANRRLILIDQFEARAGYFIPLNFSKGRTYKYFGIGSNFVWRQLESKTKGIELADGTQPYIHNYISFTQQLPKTRQHIYPKLGYSLSAAHRQQLDYNGYQVNVNGQVYLPSFGNHSIVLSGNLQQRNEKGVFFSDMFPYSRGYNDFGLDSAKMYRASANYHFPIAYPDWGFGGLIYFQRIRGNAFYDFSEVYSRDNKQSAYMQSTGAELFFDAKVWNQLPVTIGVRYSYLLDQQFAVNGNRNVWEVVLPVSLIPN
ncbi:hypothetical protein OCK74_01325 [Chitinophagaceae bacterium LB-8]|uniref:Uncharacterized protein n=1 Tax=Paraflavisolibacter caeni TaxID=2982496 RepID=A0A9X2XRV9_9BACT|nr:hypothetical protein [Paraflavisolibacter caeni]MCU7547729.1 hypothetical protein [Paraflavisolibacter caeni]